MADDKPAKKKRPWFLIFVVIIIGGMYFWKHYEIRFDKERGLVFNRRGEAAPAEAPIPPVPLSGGGTVALAPQPTSKNSVTPMTTMTIATWDLAPLNFDKLADETRAQRISDVISQFDLIAVQGVMRTTNPLDEIVRRINAKGKKYAYAIPKTIGQVPEYVAFIFDTETVKYDPAKTYEIVESSLSYRPLVGSFCTVQPPPDKAFTFNLVNIKIPDDRKDIESKVLGRIFRQVRDHDPAEDDVIMLGNFGMPVQQIDSLLGVPYLSIVHDDLPTTIDGTDSTENIIFDNKRTIECIGNAKRVDLIKLFDLKLSEVPALANHYPICAEFSVFEAVSPKPDETR